MPLMNILKMFLHKLLLHKFTVVLCVGLYKYITRFVFKLNLINK